MIGFRSILSFWFLTIFWNILVLYSSSGEACSAIVDRRFVHRSDVLQTDDVGILSEEDLYFGYNLLKPTVCDGELRGLISWFCIPSRSVRIWCSEGGNDVDSTGIFNFKFKYRDQINLFLMHDRLSYSDCLNMISATRTFLADEFVCVAGEKIKKYSDGSSLWMLERIKSIRRDGCRFRLPYQLGCDFPPFHVDENFRDAGGL